MKLGVNIDHIATLRQARGAAYPDPVVGALMCDYAGCHSIVAHLREDRRHIQDSDVRKLRETLNVPFNLEMSINKDIVDIAREIKPAQATLVPEKRQELTTEGGIDLIKQHTRVAGVIAKLQAKGVKVSVFIDPVKQQIALAKKIGADLVELNTGKFSEAKTPAARKKELEKIRVAAGFAKESGFFVAAGHGIDYENVKEIISVTGIEELNIGHSIICRAVFNGLVAAVQEMLVIIDPEWVKV